MSLIEIDGERCKRDGICVAECPMKIILMKDEESLPEIPPEREERCINCGHCLAVCPHGALTLKGTSPDDCTPVSRDELPGAEEMEHLIKSRRSIRVFREDPVPRETIEKLIDIARYAPSGHNTEPVHWRVIHDTGEVQRLAGIIADWMRMLVEGGADIAKHFHFDVVVKDWDRGVDKIVRGARHIVFAHAPREEQTAQAACTIALAELELAAYSMGVGATWGGFVHGATATFPPMMQAVGLPEGHQCFGAMLLGYPKYKYYRIPPRVEARITWK